MRSPAAHILETALALQRAPGERFRLRERPLPAGVIHLIEVAAGSPPALQAAAADVGEPEPVLIEAARFYLEQVLFADPDADAYRVLGLAADVPHETIRTHHRWLQRWLHPDRAQAGDATVFATRVNQAFSQLRSPEARHAYDVRLAEARLAGNAAPLPPETLRHWEHADEAPQRYGRRSRWLLAAGLVACVVLAVLIVRRQEPVAPWQPEEPSAGIAGDESGAMEDAADRGALARLGEALAAPEPAPVSMPTADSERVAPATAASDQLVGPHAVPAAAFVPARPAPAPPPARTVAVAAASRMLAAPALPATAPAPAPSRQREPARSAAVAPTPPAAVPLATASASAPAPASTPAQVATPSPAPNEADGLLVLQRLPLATKRMDQVAGYLASKPGAIPMWDTVQAMTQTDEARQRLDTRKGTRLELGQPDWRLRPDQASVETPYRCRSSSGAPCGGLLKVSMVWREGMWLVRAVAVEPSA